MGALILFSHGSVLCGAGETLKWHGQWLLERGGFGAVEVGFMNYSEPTFSEAIERCAAAGAGSVTVVPYFLVPGKFVKVDLPRHLNAAREQFPGLKLVVAPPIGFDDGLADALVDLAVSARSAERWRDDYERASEFCEADPQCPLYGTPRCPRVPSIHSAGTTQERSIEGGEAHLAASTPSGPEIEIHPLPSKSKAALLVMVHGSPRESANAPMFEVVDRVREGGAFPIIAVGFLECNSPDIPTAIRNCVDEGATEILAVPYFLHTGKHVADDLPALLEAAQREYPNVSFRLSEFLGRSPRLTDILLARALAASR